MIGWTTPRGWALIAAGFALALLIPVFVTQNFLLHIAILVLFSAFLGQAWNIAGGYAGQRSFGHAVFVGTGAYVTAILQTRFGWNPLLTLPPAILGGVAVGWLVGFLSFRAGLRAASPAS